MIDNIQDNEVDYAATSETRGPTPPMGAGRQPEAEARSYRDPASEALPAVRGEGSRVADSAGAVTPEGEGLYGGR
jgi:hypothetical protein